MATQSTQTSQGNQGTGDSLRSTVSSIAHQPAVEDLFKAARDYAKANPEAAALWCFGIGFVLAWKLKPW